MEVHSVMSQFYIKAWIVADEVVSVFCHGLPITQDPIQVEGATIVSAIGHGAYVHAGDLFPTLTYSNGVLSSPLCEITMEAPE
jgi:hypothetical protein